MSKETSPANVDSSPPEPEAKEGKSDEVFEVEKILAHKVTENVLFLKVRWLGYNEDEDTWEPEQDMKECASEVVQEYYNKMNVSDKTELIELLQRNMSRNNHKKKVKKRSRPESDDDTDSASDTSVKNVKKSAKKPKKQKSKGAEPSSASKTPKVPTKAALKSYEGHASSAPIYPNNAKKAAMEIRGKRNWLDSSDDEAEAPVETEIEKLANKVKEKAVKNGTLTSPKQTSPVQNTENGDSTSQQPCCSSPVVPPKKEDDNKEAPVTLKRTSTASSSAPEEINESGWSVEGIVRHVDERSIRKKLVLMTNSKTGDRKVLEAKEAFALDGWALTKYLLDRCEF